MEIALIADDTKKELMTQFCIAYCGILSKHSLCATSTTGKYIEDATGLQVEFKQNTLEIEGRVEISYRICPADLLTYADPTDLSNVAGLTLVCTYTDAQGAPRTVEVPSSEWSFYTNAMGYRAVMGELNANEMRTVVTAVVKDSTNTVVSNNYKTSIESFAYQYLTNGANDRVDPFLRAMMNFGLSAEAFLNR